jgi:hypothetical protein
VPFTYTIDGTRGFVSIVASGKITKADALATFDEIIADPDFRPGMQILSDHRELDTVVSSAFVKAWINRIAERGELFSGSRAALVESSIVRYGMARMASILAEATPLELRVFRDVDQARRWLEGSAELTTRGYREDS